MKSISIYNTLSKEKEEYKPIKLNEVGIYSCGVTVYDNCHIGHARSLYTYDVFCRYLRYRGYKVKFIRNITDIDDKIIKRANELNIPFEELTEKYINSYKQDLKSLGIGEADKEPRATKHIKDMVDMIGGLIKKGFAYEVEGDVYFKVRAFSEYGQLSGQSIESMLQAVRVETDEKKQDPLDFALWKKSKPGEPEYDSPWSKGRPGWHIECSVMSAKYLGQTFDIHAGGRDLIFPHNENEIAQAQAYTGKPFVRYWMHNGLLTVNGQKMSKSLGNFITIQDFLKKNSPVALKLFFLTAHYSSPIDYTDQKIGIAEKNIEQIEHFFSQFLLGDSTKKISKHDKEDIEKIIAGFNAVLSDDFNTPKALASIFEGINLGSRYIADDKKAALEYLRSQLQELLQILGINIKTQVDEITLRKVKKIADERLKARKNKDYKRADKLREEAKQMGFSVTDTGSSYSIVFIKQ